MTLDQIMSNVTEIFSGVTGAWNAFGNMWIVYVPLTLTIASFVFGMFCRLLFIRGRRRRGR